MHIPRKCRDYFESIDTGCQQVQHVKQGSLASEPAQRRAQHLTGEGCYKRASA